MEKHLLLTVGDELEHSHAIEFAGRFLAGAPDVKFTVLYLAPKPPLLFAKDKDFGERELETEEFARRHQQDGQRLVLAAAARLVALGFGEHSIFPRVMDVQSDTPLDIVREGKEGLYDAVVLGQRGIERVREVESSSVSRQVFLQELDFPLWVCKGPAAPGLDVLVWFDGGDDSLRALDHVGFILAGAPGRRVTLLHAAWSGSASAASLFDEGRALLAEAGVPASAVDTVFVQEGDAAEIIAREVKDDRYAAVAVGRRRTRQAGQERGLIRRLFELLDDRCVWIC